MDVNVLFSSDLKSHQLFLGTFVISKFSRSTPVDTNRCSYTPTVCQFNFVNLYPFILLGKEEYFESSCSCAKDSTDNPVCIKIKNLYTYNWISS